MGNTWYIEIQQIYHGDYPLGSPDRIGFFESEEAAIEYLDNHDRFENVDIGNWHTWNYKRFGRHQVLIKDLSNMYVIAPEKF